MDKYYLGPSGIQALLRHYEKEATFENLRKIFKEQDEWLATPEGKKAARENLKKTQQLLEEMTENAKMTDELWNIRITRYN